MVRRALLALALAASPAAAQQAVQARLAFQLEHLRAQADPERSILNVAMRRRPRPPGGEHRRPCHHADQPSWPIPPRAPPRPWSRPRRAARSWAAWAFGVAQPDVAPARSLAQQAANDDALAVGALDRPTAGDRACHAESAALSALWARHGPPGPHSPATAPSTAAAACGLRRAPSPTGARAYGTSPPTLATGPERPAPRTTTLDDAFRWAVGVRAPTGLRGSAGLQHLFGQISTGVSAAIRAARGAVPRCRDDPAEWLAGLEYRLPGGACWRGPAEAGGCPSAWGPPTGARAGRRGLAGARPGLRRRGLGDRRDALTRLRLTLCPSLAQAAAVAADRRRAAPGPRRCRQRRHR
ncbi:MAG: hypothetical protein R3F43_00670 [bacterium]